MKITVPDGQFNNYVSQPSSSLAPVVIVLQEIFGVNSDIRQTCDELASRGFIAVAPDLFWRAAPGLDLNSWSEGDWKRGLDLYNAFDLDRGIRDVSAVVEAARMLPGANGKVAAMGFCLGGLMSYLAAARLKIDAAVVYYGGSTDQHLDEAHGVVSPMLMHFGEEDEFISKEAQRQIKAAFAANTNVQIITYPGCSHAFARHTGTHFDAVAAASANARSYEFLGEKLTRLIHEASGPVSGRHS